MHVSVKPALITTLAAALVAAAGATASQSGSGAFPGKNGRIVFNDLSGTLILVNPDGSGARPARADGHAGLRHRSVVLA